MIRTNLAITDRYVLLVYASNVIFMQAFIQTKKHHNLSQFLHSIRKFAKMGMEWGFW